MDGDGTYGEDRTADLDDLGRGKWPDLGLDVSLVQLAGTLLQNLVQDCLGGVHGVGLCHQGRFLDVLCREQHV